MHACLAADADLAKWLVVTVALVPALSGCIGHEGLAAGALVGASLATTAIRGPSDSGRLAAYLSDGRVLEGTWCKVSERAPPGAVVVQTRRGLVSAAEVVAPEIPAITGTLGDDDARMICAFVGDYHSGYRIHCTDDQGTAWSGTSWRGRETGESFFHGRMAVTLHEQR